MLLDDEARIVRRGDDRRLTARLRRLGEIPLLPVEGEVAFCHGCSSPQHNGAGTAHVPWPTYERDQNHKFIVAERHLREEQRWRRAYWKGYLKLSLVTCPVALYPASSKSEKTRFHQINKKTGHRLRQQMVDEETGRAVQRENKGRGYELTKGKYVEIEPEEIEAIEFV